jgi:hypothetical protein
MDLKFQIGEQYSREDVGEICYPGVGRPKGGNWDTGYVRIGSNLIVFMNIGVSGRTGHDFDNRYDELTNSITWFGKPDTHSKQKTFERLLEGRLIPFFFARWDQKSKFKYLGIGTILSFEDNVPTKSGHSIKLSLKIFQPINLSVRKVKEIETNTNTSLNKHIDNENDAEIILRQKEGINIELPFDAASTTLRIENTACLDQIMSIDRRFSFNLLVNFNILNSVDEIFSIRDCLRLLINDYDNVAIINSYLDQFDEEIEKYLSFSIFDQLSYILDFDKKVKKNRDAFKGRFSFNGRKKLTLQETGDKFERKVTRERVRQIESSFYRFLRIQLTKDELYFLPKLEHLINQIKKMCPISLDELTKLKLSNNKDEFMTYDGLKTICQVYDYPLPFKKLKRKGTQILILDDSSGDLVEEIFVISTEVCRLYGVVYLDDILDYLKQRTDIEIERDKLHSMIENSYFIPLGEGWYSDSVSSIRKNRLANTIVKMLFCFPVIDIAEIREGFKRVVTRRKLGIAKKWNWSLPPKRIMAKYIETLDNYMINSKNQVESIEPIDSNVLGSYGNENLFIVCKIIQDQENGVIERNILRIKALEHGVNPSSLAVELSYAPWIKSFGRSIYGIRGSNPKSFDIEMLGYEIRLLDSKKISNIYDLSNNGELIITSRVNDPSHFILSLRKKYLKKVVDQDYIMKDVQGIEYGIAKFATNKSTLIGFPKALSRMHVEEGDMIKIYFYNEKNEILIESIAD